MCHFNKFAFYQTLFTWSADARLSALCSKERNLQATKRDCQQQTNPSSQRCVTCCKLFLPKGYNNTKRVVSNSGIFVLSDKPLRVPSACGWTQYQDFEQCYIREAWSGWKILQHNITGAVFIKRSAPSQAIGLPTQPHAAWARYFWFANMYFHNNHLKWPAYITSH